ncbi:1-phosphofructokinase [Neobacillus kokaensis]|uniref:Tagatose-6-phosphate kinase n=1 Tax=Neobacillus kokaensis TaxID=2759023 RepID=A0ABQ3NAF1_9BACI|nr:1-phosphofructokinase [Neobacillus kokaensis]GHI00346.1 1-phosphofructokinase [Neobacillus kokaensis]
MIYTVTLNPSLDYIVEVDGMTLGQLNRTKTEAKFPGGKGINVSQVLKTFDVKGIAIGFLGGFTGAFIENYLKSIDIETDFVEIQDDTRINIKLRTEQETEINAKGPTVTTDELNSLKSKISALTSEDCLILAGSIPSSMPKNMYEELVEICNQNGAKFVVDAEGDLLKRIVPLKPFLIKPNHHELGELFQTKIESIEEALPCGRELIKMGVRNVIVSLADKGAVFFNEECTLVANVRKGEMKSSVGAGDSMVAAFVATFGKTGNIEEAFKYSVAAGSATAFSLGLCTLEKVEELLPQVKIERR